MNKLKLAVIAIVLSSNAAFAGGILTNTNQSVSFLRNPARDAAIGLDGVYSNPAGVAFFPTDCTSGSTGNTPARRAL